MMEVFQEYQPLEFPVSYNLVEGLSILFVDIDQSLNRPRGNNVIERFFQSDTILWEFIREYVPLAQAVAQVNVFNVEDILRNNEMGYTHIVTDDRQWGDLSEGEKAQSVEDFKQTVIQIKPFIVMVLGKNTFNAIMRGSYPMVGKNMKHGFQDKTLRWKAGSDTKGSSSIFLMRKTHFKEEEERTRVGRSLLKTFRLLNNFKNEHEMHTYPPAQQHQQQQMDLDAARTNKRNLSTFLDDVTNDTRRQKRRLEQNYVATVFPFIPESDYSSSNESINNNGSIGSV